MPRDCDNTVDKHNMLVWLKGSVLAVKMSASVELALLSRVFCYQRQILRHLAATRYVH